MTFSLRGGGRPSGHPSTGSEALDALVLLLRDVRAQAQLSVEDLHELLRTSGLLVDRLPARSTLYRKLGGAGLKNERRLVEAVIGVCVPDERQADALRDQAIVLLQRAWSKDAEPVTPRVDISAGTDHLAAELISIQRELISTQAQLTAALKAGSEAEMEAARSRALLSTLLVLGTVGINTGRVTPPARVSGTDPSELRARLMEAQAERDEAKQAAYAAQSRLVELECQLADRAIVSSDHVPAGSQEWPTTRTDPVERTVPPNTSARSTGQAVPGATTSTAEWGERQGMVSSQEQQVRERTRALQQDQELREVLGGMKHLDPSGSRMASAIDGAARHLLDPAHTGRYLWAQLTKVERIGFGTALEHRMRREFRLPVGNLLDFEVAGHEVDVKFSLRASWTFGPEFQGRLCLVVHADDLRGQWSLGLLRVTPHLLRTGANRDGMRRLSTEGRAEIHWIHRDLPLPQHALPRLPGSALEAIFAKQTGRDRTDELFLRAQLTQITTTDIAAVSMNENGSMRAREAQRRLASRGILLLHGTRSRDVELAATLEVPVPAPRTWMSVRLVQAPLPHDGSPVITLAGAPWRVARPDDPETALPKAFALGFSRAATR